MSQNGSDMDETLQGQLEDKTPPASPPTTPPDSSPEIPPRHLEDGPQSPDISDDEHEEGEEIDSPRNIEKAPSVENLQITDEGGTQKKSKRRSDELIGLKDELDFEEADRESGEEEEEEGGCGSDDDEEKDDLPKEEGELSEEEEEDSSLRQEPKTVCRFFNKGQCTWGTNCRFLHPGVSDKGNYNMFAPSRPQTLDEKEEKEKAERERPREVRRYVPEPCQYETSWERGLRFAKDLMKRANKRKETDADFEEKRFNLGLGQAELDRENDYYTRPASPVYKPSADEVIEYLDPFERQAIRHFRGGHFENFEVRYNVDPHYPPVRVGGGAPPPAHPPHGRSRRDKYEREGGHERGGGHKGKNNRGGEQRWVWREAPQHANKRFQRGRGGWGGGGGDDRYKNGGGRGGGGGGRAPTGRGGEPEAWADPWARRKNSSPQRKKTSRTRSYSSGSSSRSTSGSSRSSRSSYSSYSRSRSKSSNSSHSSHSGSSSRSRSPIQKKFNPRQQNTVMIKGRPVPIPITSNPMKRPSDPRGEPRDPRLTIPRRPMELKVPKQEPRDKRPGPPPGRGDPPRIKPLGPKERVDAFGRIPKKTAERAYSKSPPRRRKRSASASGSSSSGSSRSRSRSASSSSSRSSSSSSQNSEDHRNERRRLANANILAYSQSNKGKAVDPAKMSGLKQQIKLTLKGAANKTNKPLPPALLDEDSGESDDNTTSIPRKRKAPSPDIVDLPSTKAPSPPPTANSNANTQKKSTVSRRDELLKQLRAVEDAIKRKRAKVN